MSGYWVCLGVGLGLLLGEVQGSRASRHEELYSQRD